MARSEATRQVWPRRKAHPKSRSGSGACGHLLASVDDAESLARLPRAPMRAEDRAEPGRIHELNRSQVDDQMFSIGAQGSFELGLELWGGAVKPAALA